MTQAPGALIPTSKLQLKQPMSLAVFDEYEHAQKAVDYLSDHEFPVQNVMIVGTDLRQVERVTGRLTSGRVIASGAASGAWMGLFFGSLMWLFVQGIGVAMFLSAVLAGAVFGLVWAWLFYRMAGGSRDFTSVTQVVATRYELLVEAHLGGNARRLLEDMRREGQGVPVSMSAPGAPHGQPSWGPPQGPAQSAPGTQGWSAPPTGPEAPSQAAAPQYRTYGEALDAERAAQESGSPSDTPAGDAPRGESAGAPGDGVAAEDAHDTR